MVAAEVCGRGVRRNADGNRCAQAAAKACLLSLQTFAKAEGWSPEVRTHQPRVMMMDSCLMVVVANVHVHHLHVIPNPGRRGAEQGSATGTGTPPWLSKGSGNVCRGGRTVVRGGRQILGKFPSVPMSVHCPLPVRANAS
ncbi:hypothetical protein PAHAL_1G414800 [Panicum hallii]|uniref:Uncharacterized protein n=1 Tax=Panicum hallii TaxID=206008 RepID=A0A2T8KXX5_9POAL|nr:hypothetical protein PAHAL_1G414800 [Panicum hallii]